MFYMPSEPGENQDRRLREFKSRSVKTWKAVKAFHLQEFYKLWFSPGYEDTENMFSS